MSVLAEEQAATWAAAAVDTKMQSQDRRRKYEFLEETQNTIKYVFERLSSTVTDLTQYMVANGSHEKVTDEMRVAADQAVVAANEMIETRKGHVDIQMISELALSN
jgi:hypothetical protein